jgi:hypothetical protein
MLEAIQRAAGPGQIQVVAINIEDRQQFRKLARGLSDFQLIIAHDGLGQSQAKYGVNEIPHLLIIGRDGRIQKMHRGYAEKSLDGIVAEINAALVERPAGQ